MQTNVWAIKRNWTLSEIDRENERKKVGRQTRRKEGSIKEEK